MKEEHLIDADNIFEKTGAQITKAGHRNLVADPLSRSIHVQASAEVGKQSKAACNHHPSQLHVQHIYTALTHGLMGIWLYPSWTVSKISNLLQPLEEVIRHHLIPALTGRAGLTNLKREVFALPWAFKTLPGIQTNTLCVPNRYPPHKLP